MPVVETLRASVGEKRATSDCACPDPAVATIELKSVVALDNDCACPQPAAAEATESSVVLSDSADPIQVELVLPKI